VTTNDYKVNEPLTHQDDIWVLSLSSGDVLNKKKWKQYYDNDDDENDYYNGPEWKNEENSTKDKTGHVERSFKTGAVVGMLVDLD
jgi:hypothetical protein